MSKILVKAEPPLSNKILIRKEIAVQQLVGQGLQKPTFGQFARNALARRGQGVTGAQRLRGLVGMGGKVAAAAVTAQTAYEGLQNGNLAAGLQAGINYQGMDPTATFDSNVSQKINPNAPALGRKNPVGVQALPPAKYPKDMQPNSNAIPPSNVNSSIPTPTYGDFARNSDPQLTRRPHDNTGLVPVASPLPPAHTQIHSGTQALLNTLNAPNNPPVAPAPVAPAPVAPQQHVAPAPAPVAPAPVAPQGTSLTGGITNYMQQQPMQGQQVPPQQVPPQQVPPQQVPPQQGSMVNQVHYGPNTPPGQEYPKPDPYGVEWNNTERIAASLFTGAIYDKLGPDMVYKMTPHHIATLSAYMYLKLS